MVKRSIADEKIGLVEAMLRRVSYVCRFNRSPIDSAKEIGETRSAGYNAMYGTGGRIAKTGG